MKVMEEPLRAGLSLLRRTVGLPAEVDVSGEQLKSGRNVGTRGIPLTSSAHEILGLRVHWRVEVVVPWVGVRIPARDSWNWKGF